MDDEKIYKISLSISLAGLVILFFWSSVTEPERIGIGSLGREDVGSEVEITGSVGNIKQVKEGHIFFHVKDRKEKILVVLFKDDADEMSLTKESLNEGEEVKITGEVKKYEDQLEIIPRRIERV